MTIIDIAQVGLLLAAVLLLVKPIGWYMAQIYTQSISSCDKASGAGEPRSIPLVCEQQTKPATTSQLERQRVYTAKPYWITNKFRNLEVWLYRCCGINAQDEMDWKQYFTSMLIFNILGIIFVYLCQRVQSYLPLNPQYLPAVEPALAFNTAVSFATNTNWQAYSGETTMSYATQMLALTVQNFTSAATGMAVLVALIRGITRCEVKTIGNFWVDISRSIIYILLPLSCILAIILCSQDVIQNFKPNQSITPLQSLTSKSSSKGEGHIAMGPVASQIAIKQLGTNGGGFFNANAAHPFENPSPFTNLVELIAILLIPASFCYTFGIMINDHRQGWAILAAMLIIFVPCTFLCINAEQESNLDTLALQANEHKEQDTLRNQNTAQQQMKSLAVYPNSNMEGKETRFGITSSALWATATTATANGSVNSALDSFTPVGGGICLFLMHLGEIVFGGVGSGLYSMLIIIIITVFIAGLMVGRTPEYLGKKIEPFEIKMATLAALIMPIIVLSCTALACVTPAGVASILNPGAHGFSEILYAFTSMGNNNGSAFAGLNANTTFYNILGGVVMFVARYLPMLPVLAIAGSLANKKIVPCSYGTLATHSPLFIFMLICVAITCCALSFIPALCFGPIIEQLSMGIMESTYG